MTNDYTMRPGKESVIANRRQAMEESQHSAANAFVKAEQMKLKSLGGKAPNLKPEAQNFNAYMCNNGRHAQELSKEITKGLEKDAFPVR